MKIVEDKVQKSDFEEKVIEVRKVTKKTTGGNNIKFAALVVVGNRDGLVGAGYAKAKDVNGAITKAIGQAKKNLIQISIKGTTIAHEVMAKYGSAKLFIKPAPKGSGIIAGSSVRTVLDLSGIHDISAKIIGGNNKICNVRCALKALTMLKS